MKNFSQNSVKTALCGVVGSERVFKRVWDSSQQAKSVRQAIARTGRFTEKGTLFLWLTLIRNTKTKEFWRKYKKIDWNYHITQKVVLENRAAFLRDMAGAHWGPPCFGYQGGPQQTPAIPPEKSNYLHSNFETKCPKAIVVPVYFYIGALAVYPPEPPPFPWMGKGGGIGLNAL